MIKTRYLIIAIFGAILFALGIPEKIDPDHWWHLKTGQYILSHGIPQVDIFSFSMQGHPWTTHEWLSEVLMWLVYRSSGFLGLTFMFSGVGVVTFTLVALRFPRQPYFSMMISLLTFSACVFLWNTRPQMFNVLMLAGLLWILEAVRDKRIPFKWLYGVPFFMLLWANLHSGVLLGFVILALYALGDFLEGRWSGVKEGIFSEEELRHLVFVIFLSVLLALINPSGSWLFLYPFFTLSSKTMQTGILEWFSPNFHHYAYWPLLVLFNISFLSFMFMKRRLHLSEILLFLGSFSCCLMARRHITFFAVVAAPVICRNFFEGVGPMDFKQTFLGVLTRIKKPFRDLLYLILFAGVIGGAAYEVRSKTDIYPTVLGMDYPVGAVDFLKKKNLTQERIYNFYDWGGFLIWNEIPVFIDGRADVYGDKLFGDYQSVNLGITKWQSILDQYKISYVLFPSGQLLCKFLSLDSGWESIYDDGMATIFKRIA